MPAWSVLAEDTSNIPENVPNIWKCIGCSAGKVGTRMSLDEQEANLNDLWGKEILRQGKFPQEVKDSQEAIAEADASLTQKIYLVAEGGQIPLSIAPRNADRNQRLAITWKGDGILSTLLSASPGSTTGFLQVIAWDSKKKKFNYYELNRDNNWSWAGDSSHARQPQFMGKGCFDCHHNGSVIMKELKRPWNNWTSQLATIDLSVLPEIIAQDPNLANLIGAEVLEQDIRGGVSQYYNAWLDSHVSEDIKTVTGVPELLRHLTTTTSVNFESNLANIGALGKVVTPPKNFFIYDDVLSKVAGDVFGDAGYQFPSTIGFDSNKFKQTIDSKEFALRQCRRIPNTNKCEPDTVEYEQKGTTFHPFFIPVPSNEDTFVIQQLMNFQVIRDNQRKNIKFITDKFAAAVLMVDFQNPIFSPVRSSLQTYAKKLDQATIDNQGASNIPALFVAEIEAAVKNQPPCSVENLDSCTAEQQFLNTWNLPDATWKDQVNQRIQSYLNAVADQIANGNGVSDYVDLSISRRQEFASIKPIKNLFEFSLLLPQSDLPVNSPLLRMQSDGQVGVVN
ncbi:MULTISPECIES: hypothetical protein [unclassified Okeania]|uniref:hypothetical protein n=1 Tax=unclassified Okeania TaxID=2634635 RepID=UPI00257980AA|nr:MULTISPECIES: hypothetical protein [unclassified Okeania]